jgi:hypothetical protein
MTHLMLTLQFCRDGLVTMLKRKGNGYSKKTED